MTDLISRAALLNHLRKERDDYFREHFAQDPATGTYEASNAKEEYLAELDERIEFIENFAAVEPIATLINNNQPGWTNIIETAPNVTIDVGTKLYAAREQIVGHLGAALMQALPSDDQIIMGHVKDAYELAVALPRSP
jgi:hypothetical protein